MKFLQGCSALSSLQYEKHGTSGWSVVVVVFSLFVCLFVVLSAPPHSILLVLLVLVCPHSLPQGKTSLGAITCC